MKLLHTSDWHLGHTLHEADRTAEHEAFLGWLARTIVERDVDALLVTGDVFDSANPPASAQKLWYRFLVEAGARRDGLQIVAIAGNHDSAARLEAPREVLAHLNVHVVGELPREDGKLHAARLLVPLKGEDGRTCAWVAAVPYLRPTDLSGVDGGDDEAFGVDPVYMGVGGTIPFVGPFAEAFGGVPALLLGPADPGSRIHGEDESLHLGDWARLVDAEIRLLAYLRRGAEVTA